MFKKIQILTGINPQVKTDLWVNNQLINNVDPPNAQSIIIFHSGDLRYQYLGTLQQFKTDLGL